MDVDEDNQFHSQIYSTNKYNNDAATTAPNSAASSAVVLAQIQADDNEHQLFRGWHNSSRIFRVSRASGGKDRHSKVLTSKGLRDRRVRLSVSTAIQFYDLQDRLGYDQPSKAVEWLIKAAADSIAELPSLHGPFPDCVDAKLGFHESAAADTESQHQQQKNLSASSTSETSKGSGLSLTRTDVRVNQRVKARERARERAKEKECESEHQTVNDGQRRRTSTTQATVANPISFSSTFTELLTGGNQSGSSPSNLNNSTAPMMDYFTNDAGMISPAPARSAACLFLGQTQMGISMNNMPPSAFHLTTGPHHQHQHDVHHFSFGHQNLIPSGNDDHQYDLNFTISQSSPSGVAAGFNNRGTLQSNSPASSLLHHHHNLHQRYTNNNAAAGAAAAVSMEGSNMPAFFMTSTAAMDNHHFSTGLDGGLHLYYGDHKDKGKN